MLDAKKEIVDAKLTLAQMVSDEWKEQVRNMLQWMRLISWDASRVLLELLEDNDLEKLWLLTYEDAKEKSH